MTHKASTSTDPPAKPLASPGCNAPPEAVREIMDQLHRRVGQERDVPNQRRSERHPWVTALTVVVEDLLGNPRTLEVTTHDISAEGFSFVYKQFLHLGTRIEIRFESLRHRPSLYGIVRNCYHVGGMHHRIGVQFTSSKTK